VDHRKLVQQVIRSLLTMGLLVMAYRGRRWASSVLLVLCGLAALGAMIGLVTIESPALVLKAPLLVMVLVYSIGLYHFGFSESYKAFMAHQRNAVPEGVPPDGPG
jgi:hypothetical protein